MFAVVTPAEALDLTFTFRTSILLGAEQQQPCETHINDLAAAHPELRAAQERLDNLYQISGAAPATLWFPGCYLKCYSSHTETHYMHLHVMGFITHTIPTWCGVLYNIYLWFSVDKPDSIIQGIPEELYIQTHTPSFMHSHTHQGVEAM